MGAGAAEPPDAGLPTDLIGRETALALVREGIRHARMVTITGPGGIGKTRVAEAFAAGGGMVDLAAVTDRRFVPSEIARALELRLDPAQPPLDALVGALEGSDRLLVLDNLEQIDGVAAVVEPLLLRVPGLRVLATSRVPMGIRGEVDVPLAPLDVPADDAPDAVEASPAGALFLRGARSVGALRSLDTASARDVARLCRALDGIPLGLELAARRLRVLSLSDILRRLERGDVTLLRDPERPERQRSLEAVLEWSLSLLSDEQRRALAAASVCPGGFDLDTLAALLPSEDADGALDALDGLITSGLVRRTDDGSMPRFALLEPVRTAIRRRMPEAELAAFGRRHGEVMVDLVRRHGWRFEDGDAFEFAPLSRERDGIRATLVAASALTDGAPLLEMSARLGGYWYQAAEVAEAVGWLDQALAGDDGDADLRTHALATRMYLTLDWSDTIEQDVAELHAAAHASTDAVAAVRALVYAAYPGIERHVGDPRASLLPAKELAAGAGLERWQVRIDMALGLDAMARDDMVEARRSLESAAATARRVADAGTESQVLTNLALAAVALGDAGEAAVAAQRAVELLSDDARPTGRIWALCILALTRAEAGDAGGARATLTSAMPIILDHLAPWTMVVALDTAVVVLAAAGADELALRCFGASDRLRGELRVELSPTERAILESAVRRATGRLGAVAAGLATRAGASEDAETLTRSLAEELRAGPQPRAAARESTRVRHGELTRREVEILGLLAEGRSDGEIAEALVISPKTASVHVSNVKAKLGVETRLEAALAARELGFGAGRHPPD